MVRIKFCTHSFDGRGMEISILYFRQCQLIVDYLKMDVEGSEVQAIEGMYHDGVLDKIKQIGVEVCRIRENESKVLLNERC